MRLSFIFYLLIFELNITFAQDIVKMEKEGGVYLIPCKVNGLPLKFIFDTGASDVSISLTEAVFMLKNGYLNESDIKGSVIYSIANGEIAEGTKINIRNIVVGKQSLQNVEASIIHSTEAPLLFGQSAMERFGKFTMDYSNSNLIIGGSSNLTSNSTNSVIIKTVKIGTQTWMTENLSVDRFRNGDIIPEVKTDEEWKRAGENKQPAWCYYENNSKNNSKFGKLYNYYAIIDPRGMIPEGWHIPSKSEWYVTINENTKPLDGGTQLKSKNGWHQSNSKNGNGNNISGLTIQPAGGRYGGKELIDNPLYPSRQGFDGLYFSTWLWTSDFDRYENSAEIVTFGWSHAPGGAKVHMSQGLSIRLLKD
jgi:clan AA aspartic protease (TIGR02281 family)